MNYRYRSVRCRHGMCTETVGCEECGVKAKPGAGAHLLRVDRRVLSQPPQSYIHDGGHSMSGNSNARARG